MTGTGPPWTFTRAHLLVLLAYLTAAAAAAATVLFYDAHPLLQVLVANVVATVVIFLFSLLFRNSSFYDPYWSVAPVLIALYFLILPDQAVTARQIMVSALVLAWSVRLTGNWAYGWQGIRHEDWRYEKLARSAGGLWWPLSFAGVHLFPTLVVYLGCIPLYPALVAGEHPLNVMDVLAALLGAGAVWLEFQADRELHRFRARRASRSEVLDTGTWAVCRHPNYLGEIGFWLSLFVFGVAAWGWVYPFSWLGPVVMMGLFLVVSIPMIERKLGGDKPGYAAYRQRTPMLLPRGRPGPFT